MSDLRLTPRPTVLLVATPESLPRDRRIWGTGGWLQPEKREALDWLTLVRLLGWELEVAAPSSQLPLRGTERVVLFACDPDLVSQDAVDQMTSSLERQPLLVVCRAPRPDTPLARCCGVARTADTLSGHTLEWHRPPERRRAWRLKQSVPAHRLELEAGAEVWARLDDAPIVCSRMAARGAWAVLGLHPSAVRDADPAGTALVKTLLTWGPPPPLAWLDLEETLILRMDDPGGAQNVYSRDWRYAKLSEADWLAVGRTLAAREARVSLGYIPGWVDDGDRHRGRLTVGGEAVPRRAGAVHPSPLVRYEDTAGHAPGTVYDYEAEYRGIQELRRQHLGDVELHGYTHMHPDLRAWARAPDRFENWPQTAWYRELGRAAAATIDGLPKEEHPLVRALALFRDHFGNRPTTLICPGDQWTDGALERALDVELLLVASYYLALRHHDRFCWAYHVCAPYLDRPDAAWFDSGLPVVGYFHDYELAVEGVGWMTRWLDAWADAGARRFIDFRELAGTLACRLSMSQVGTETELRVEHDCTLPVRPIAVKMRVDSAGAGELSARIGERQQRIAAPEQADGTRRVELPPQLFAQTPTGCG